MIKSYICALEHGIKTENTMKIKDVYSDELSSYPDLLTISEIQEILNISKSTVLRMLNKNELTRLRFSYGTRVSKTEVLKLIIKSIGKEKSA
jgi:excisionase family DNA binding protein